MLSDEKKALRKQAAFIRDSLPYEYIDFASAKITRHLLASDVYKNSSVIFAFISMENEPDTRAIIENAWKDGKTVVVPKCIKNRQMELWEIKDFSELKPGAYGILEPVCDTIKVSDADLALIPCVAANMAGERIGHGGGYYDVFLEKSEAKKVCICFEELIMEDIPMDELDKKMDYIVTENGFFTCKG